ncbi:MAG: hypothetical protein QOJ27_914 [Sphingomonadales bacterium]|nr:hypothetical protein [Sphingomonadales bacterium]
MLSLVPLLVLAAAAPAETPSEAGAQRVCRPAAPSIGSHIKRSKICRTAAQWEEYDNGRRAASITTKAPQPEPWERTRPQ